MKMWFSTLWRGNTYNSLPKDSADIKSWQGNWVSFWKINPMRVGKHFQLRESQTEMGECYSEVSHRHSCTLLTLHYTIHPQPQLERVY